MVVLTIPLRKYLHSNIISFLVRLTFHFSALKNHKDTIKILLYSFFDHQCFTVVFFFLGTLWNIHSIRRRIRLKPTQVKLLMCPAVLIYNTLILILCFQPRTRKMEGKNPINLLNLLAIFVSCYKYFQFLTEELRQGFISMTEDTSMRQSQLSPMVGCLRLLGCVSAESGEDGPNSGRAVRAEGKGHWFEPPAAAVAPLSRHNDCTLFYSS